MSVLGQDPAMKKIILLPLLLMAVSCSQKSISTKRLDVKGTGKVSMIVMGVENITALRAQARDLGVTVEGNKILIVTGDAISLSNLEIEANQNFAYLADVPLHLEKASGFIAQSEGLYLAKKDFGILEFWKNHPEADGRGVTVGVLDDGISPHQSGFMFTTTGERKFLKKGTSSSFTTFVLEETETGYKALVDETRPTFSYLLDLNGDDLYNNWEITVNKKLDQACIAEICRGSFGQTGEYFTGKNPKLAIMVEIDKENKKIQIFQPERGGDLHGEGVASVLAGYKIGNLPGFDGVAPGAKIVDYDLSEFSDKPSENEYTLGTFLKGLDWLGTNGAEVANISYSMGFTSALTQTFMRKALDELIIKHNMVISFSAGNNGPGLGSLNRRSIYPSNALVVGAYISKELDERVHGVTGIPDEGRVVFYSSRGPGMGGAPTLISPLSSLTQSTPGEGHMAFSGTSSASPALAGAAAVLISAIKQEGFKVHAPSVVHALRLSGKRLKNEPFIFQGAGLPQVEAALAIYKKMIKGEIFENVNVEVNKEHTDEVPSAGIFIRASQNEGIDSRAVFLKGAVSEAAPSSARVNLLAPVRLEYSAGITGPRELWISSSESTFYVDISVKDAIQQGQLESFGEIKVISKIDGSTLASVPVTIVNDVNILARPSVNINLGSQEGRRFHLNIPEGVNGFKVRADVLDGDYNTIVVSVFDTHQIRIVQQRLSAEIWVPATRGGYYQVGVSMRGGTGRGAKVRLEMENIDLKLKTTVAKASESEIVIQNNSKSSVSGIVQFTPVSEIVKSILVTSAFDGSQEFTEKLGPGDYEIVMKPTEYYDLSYFYPNCSIRVAQEDGKFIISDSSKISVETSKLATFRCMPFDYGMKSEVTVTWLMQLIKVSNSIEERIDAAPFQKKELRVKNLKPGRYKVEVKDPISESKISIGDIEII